MKLSTLTVFFVFGGVKPELMPVAPSFVIGVMSYWVIKGGTDRLDDCVGLMEYLGVWMVDLVGFVDYQDVFIEAVYEFDQLMPDVNTTEIEIIDGCYWLNGKRVTTFTINPKGMIDDLIIGDFIDYKGDVIKDVKFRTTYKKFLMDLPSTWCQVVGLEWAVGNLITYLLDIMKLKGSTLARGITQMGYDSTYWITTDQTVISSGVIEDGKAGVKPLISGGPVITMVEHWNGDILPFDSIPIVALGWLGSLPFKTRLGIPFPILNIHGPVGGGKTSLIWDMLEFMGYKTPQFGETGWLDLMTSIPVAFEMKGYYNRLGRFKELYDTKQGGGVIVESSRKLGDNIVVPCRFETVKKFRLDSEFHALGSAYIRWTLDQDLEPGWTTSQKQINKWFPKHTLRQKAHASIILFGLERIREFSGVRYHNELTDLMNQLGHYVQNYQLVKNKKGN